MMHTTGTTSFSLIRNKYKNENGGVYPDSCKMFELTHVCDSEKAQEPKTKQAIALMKDKIEKKKASKRASQLPEVLDDFEINEIYTFVLGKERPGRMRGFGIGVVQDQVPKVGLQKIGVHLEVQVMKEKYEAEIETIRKESQEKEDKLREEISQQALATTEKFKNMDIAMKKQEALLAVLLGAYKPSDLLAAIRMKGGFSCQPSMSHIQPSYDRNMDDVFIPQISSELQDQVATN